jgi:hypothetical protein
MDIRWTIWLKRIDAKANIRYFGDLEDRYAIRLRCLQFTGLVCTSGAVFAWASKSSSFAVPALSLLAAVVSAALMAFRIPDAVAAAKSSMRHWTRREIVWDMLWLANESDPAAVDARRLEAEIRADREFDAPQVPWNAKIALRAERDTYQALGLPLPTP